VLLETNIGQSVISFASLRYARLPTTISAEKFSWSSDMWCPNILGALLYFEKKQLILFYIQNIW